MITVIVLWADYSGVTALCMQSVQLAANGRRTVMTAYFVAALTRVNYDWSFAVANRLIERYQSTFKYVSTEEGERRTFLLFNPNNVCS